MGVGTSLLARGEGITPRTSFFLFFFLSTNTCATFELNMKRDYIASSKADALESRIELALNDVGSCTPPTLLAASSS